MTHVTFKPFIIAFLVCFHLAIMAQVNPPIILVDIEGAEDVKLTTKERKDIKVRSGAAVKSGADVEIKKDDTVLMLDLRVFNRLGEGKHTLPTSQASQGLSLHSFDPVFADYVMASYSMTFQALVDGHVVIKEKSSRGDGWVLDARGNDIWGINDQQEVGAWGVKKKGGVSAWGVKTKKGLGAWGVKDPSLVGGWGVKKKDGVTAWGAKEPNNSGNWGVKKKDGVAAWGEDDIKINVLNPGGKYTDRPYKLSWFSENEADQYLFCVFDEDLNQVKSVIVNKNNLIFDFAQLDKNKVYYWQVFAKEMRAISPPMSFEVVGQEEVDSVKGEYQKSNIYNDASNNTKLIMKAIAYEKNHHYIAAQNIYESLLQMDSENTFIRVNFAAYSMRLGQYGKARQLLEQL